MFRDNQIVTGFGSGIGADTEQMHVPARSTADLLTQQIGGHRHVPCRHFGLRPHLSGLFHRPVVQRHHLQDIELLPERSEFLRNRLPRIQMRMMPQFGQSIPRAKEIEGPGLGQSLSRLEKHARQSRRCRQDRHGGSLLFRIPGQGMSILERRKVVSIRPRPVQQEQQFLALTAGCDDVHFLHMLSQPPARHRNICHRRQFQEDIPACGKKIRQQPQHIRLAFLDQENFPPVLRPSRRIQKDDIRAESIQYLHHLPRLHLLIPHPHVPDSQLLEIQSCSLCQFRFHFIIQHLLSHLGKRPCIHTHPSGQVGNFDRRGCTTGNRLRCAPAPPTASGGPLPLMWPRVATGFR